MKKLVFPIILLLTLTGTSYSQIERKALIPKGYADNKEVTQPGGLKTTIKGSVGYLQYDYLPINNGGFMRRNGLTFQYFDSNLEKKWEKTLKQNYGLKHFPSEYTTSNSDNIFFFELGRKTNKEKEITLTKISIKDGSTEVANASLESSGVVILGTFGSSKGFHYVYCDVDSKKNEITYYLGSFSGSDLKHTVKQIYLPKDKAEKPVAFQVGAYETISGLWRANDPFASLENGIRLIRSYAGNMKTGSYISSEALLLNSEGNFSEHIKTSFSLTPVNYFEVQCLYNEQKNEFFTVALTKNSSLEFIITDKTGNEITSKTHTLSEIGSLIPFETKYPNNYKSGPRKVCENIFYDGRNNSYLLTNVLLKPKRAYITHINNELNVARIDFADWINTLGMSSSITTGGNVTQRYFQLEGDWYNGSASLLILNLKNLKNAYKSKSIQYSHLLYDSLIENSLNSKYKDYLNTIINTSHGQLIIIENAKEQSLEAIVEK
ncbi:hypothetical protein RCC89_00890 [Cytophagaceae bacterium ABcell3]|nr:hypothetical protein RCC89_00890 [Cytophagaceae bacterium ABcell3]